MTKNLIGKCGVLAAGMLVLGLASTLRAADQKVVVALKPDKNPDQMIEEKKALADFLSPKLGKPVEVIIPTSSAVIIEGFANGTIDVAYLSSLDMINARKAGAAEILLAGEIDGKTSYQSYWVTLKEKPYKSVEELKGKPIAFASRTSTSGYIIPMWDLKQKGLISEPDPEQFFGAGNVSYGTGYVSAIERVLNGQVEAAAVSYYVLDKDKHLSAEQRAQLRNLAEQGPVPTHVLAVRTGIAAEDRHKLKEALVSLNEEEHVSLRDRLFT
jgi:phosphonate transport system substrate-binding protein